MQWQDEWAGFADAQARAHVNADFLKPCNFFEQFADGEHYAVANVAGGFRAHDAAGDEVQRGFYAVDDQCVAGIVAAVKAHYAAGAFGKPINELAFAFIAPLGAYHYDVTTRLAARCGGRDQIVVHSNTSL